jgi:type II secretory ATPase GspE/PulE/Tfp pilus assembly ATPase PilB-like protein
MMTINEEGILRRPLFGRKRLTRWDDLEGTDRLPPRLRDAASLALTTPLLAGSLAAIGGRFSAWLAGAHGTRAAARALLEAATHLGASDLHLEPAESGAQIRLRLEGELHPFCTLSHPAAQRLGAAIKGQAGCLPYRSDVVQEGRIPREGVCADVRASFIPVALGERIALRLFGRLRSLDELGLPSLTLEMLKGELSRASGLIVVSGGTGSGKTTTLYAALGFVAASRGGAHLSLEDPVEQRLRKAGIPVDQAELCPERGITGESMLAAALRQDVDVLAVGEIRTAAEARLAVHAAHTGRLVLAGIHAGSPSEAYARFLDLGVEEPRLRASLGAVLQQSLEKGSPRRMVATLATAAMLCGERLRGVA